LDSDLRDFDDRDFCAGFASQLWRLHLGAVVNWFGPFSAVRDAIIRFAGWQQANHPADDRFFIGLETPSKLKGLSRMLVNIKNGIKYYF